jgi:putative PEP-CTERM system TPR-repeat lipoprotein
MKKTIVALVVGASIALAGCNEPTPMESIIKGNEYLSQDDYRGASIEFKAVLQNNNVSPELAIKARMGLAKTALHHRDFDGAIIELEKAKSLLPNLVTAPEVDDSKSKKINALLARAAHQSSSEIYLMDIEGEGNPEVAYYQIVRLTNQRNLEEAKALYETIKSDGGIFPQLSRVLVDSIEFTPELASESMPDLYDPNLILLDEEASEVALLSTGVALRAGRNGDAVGYLEYYIDLNPRDYERMLQLSHLMVSEGMHTEASPFVDKLLEVFPSLGMINELGAVVAYENKDFEKAISTASAGIISNPNSIMPRLITAYSSEMLGDSKKALTHLSVVIDKLPADHPAQRLYIKLKAQNGELADVSQRALELNDLTSSDAPLFSNLGLEMMRRGDIESAQKFADKAEALGGDGDGASALGLLQLSLGDDDAFETLESAFSNKPDSMIAGNSLATAYLTAGRYDDALALSNKWIGEEKKVVGNMLRGVSLARMSKYSEAQEAFSSVLRESPSHFMARAGYLETSIQLGNEKEAESKFSSWVVEGGMAGLFRNYLASSREKNGVEGVKEAISVFDGLIEAGSISSSEAYLVSGQSHYLMRNFKKASDMLGNVSGDLAETSNYLLLKSTVNERINDNAAALEAYRAWQKVSPELPLPVVGEVRVLAKMGNYSDAINALDFAMPRLDNKLPGRIMRMQLLVAMRDWGQLRSDYMRLPLEVQEMPFGKAVNGVLEVQRGNHAAASSIAPLLKNYPNEEFLRWAVAGYTQTPELKKDLIALLEDFVEKEPNSAMALFMLGNEYANKGDSERAIGPYERAFKITPNNALILNNLAYTEIQVGQIKDAVEHARRAVEQSPETPSFTETLASALIANGEKSEARAVMQRLIDKEVKVNSAFMETYRESAN